MHPHDPLASSRCGKVKFVNAVKLTSKGSLLMMRMGDHDWRAPCSALALMFGGLTFSFEFLMNLFWQGGELLSVCCCYLDPATPSARANLTSGAARVEGGAGPESAADSRPVFAFILFIVVHCS